MSAARVSRCAAALARRSSTSMLPRGSLLTGTTCMPAMTALAGLVPWADWGIRHVVRCVVAPGAMIGPDHQESGVLSLRAGVRLERDRREAGDLSQLVLQLAEEQLVARGLVARGERMQPVELAPAHRHHLGRGIQLHGAGAERDHRRGQREVAGLQPLDVAQHLGLGVMPVEHRVLQKRRGPRQRRGMARSRSSPRCRPA